MQYILMLYVNEAGWSKLTKAEQEQSSAATTMRVANGKPQVLDGPYADSKEQNGSAPFCAKFHSRSTCEEEESPPDNAATPTVTSTSSPIPTSTAVPCVGDCENTSTVSVADLVKGVNIALGAAALSDCSAFDCNGNGDVTVDCLVRAVDAALNGCLESSH